MKRLIIALIVSLLLSIIPLQVKDATLTIFYGLIGVIFSVGMSLIISFNGSAILNKDFKDEIRGNVHEIRDNFLINFLLCSALYVVYSLLPVSWQLLKLSPTEGISIHFTWSLSVLLYHIYSMIALISNYIEIQKLYEDIEDRVAKELNQKKA